MGNFFGLSSTSDSTCTACARTRKLAEEPRSKSSEIPCCSTRTMQASWSQRTSSYRASRQSAWIERLGLCRSMSSSTFTAPWSESKRASVDARAAMAGGACLLILRKDEIALLLTSCCAASCTSLELRTRARGVCRLRACSRSSMALSRGGFSFSSSLSWLSSPGASCALAAHSLLIGTPNVRRSFSRRVADFAACRAWAAAFAARAPCCLLESRACRSRKGPMVGRSRGAGGGLTYPRAK